jgi:hypothetical protein
MGSVTNESDVRIREGVQPGTWVRFGGGDGVCCLIGCLLEAHAGDSGQESSLVAEVDVRGPDDSPRRTLVTLGAPIQSYRLSDRLRAWALLTVVRVLGPVGFIGTGVRDVLLSLTTRAQDPEAGALVLNCWCGMNRAGLANAVVSISPRRPDLTPRLGQIGCPT